MIYSFAGPRTLAFFRIVIFSTWFFSILYDKAYLLASFPPEATYSLGFLQFLPDAFHDFFLTPAPLHVLSWTALVASACAALGLTRRSWLYILAALLLVLYEPVRCSLFSRLPHTRLCLHLLAVLCCFFPVADAWCLSRKPEILQAPQLYRLAARLMLFTITLFYSFIGTSRLLRWDFSQWNEKVMAHFIIDGLYTFPQHPDPLGLWIVERPWALWAGVVFFFCFSLVETLAPAALFSRRKCLGWAAALLLMHLCSTFVLKIPFVEQSVLLLLFFAEPLLNRFHLRQNKAGAFF